jgi:serine/threonine protein kinase
MINQAPLFPGDSEIDQLFRIFRVLGTPDDDTWPSVTTLPDYKAQFPKWRAKEWKDITPALDPDGVDLLKRLLRYAPHERISARDACAHKWFDDYEPARRDFPKRTGDE